MGTRRLNLYRLPVCIKSKKKLNTGSPDLEEASGIDKQGLLRLGCFFQQKIKMITKNNKMQ
jgi:hypothetical protein